MIEVVLKPSAQSPQTLNGGQPPRTEGLPLWIDVVAPSEEELAALGARYGIPLAALREATAPRHLPKCERIGGDTTFVVARGFDEEAPADADAFGAITRKLAFFLGNRFLITIHRRRLPFLEVLKSSVRERGSREPVYLQAVMLEVLLAGVETFHAPLEEAELRVHDLETAAQQLASEATGERSNWRAR